MFILATFATWTVLIMGSCYFFLKAIIILTETEDILLEEKCQFGKRTALYFQSGNAITSANLDLRIYTKCLPTSGEDSPKVIGFQIPNSADSFSLHWVHEDSIVIEAFTPIAHVSRCVDVDNQKIMIELVSVVVD